MLSQYAWKLARKERLAVQKETASIATSVGSERRLTLVVNSMFINMYALTIAH